MFVLGEPVTVRHPLVTPTAVSDAAVASLVLAAQPRYRPGLVLLAVHWF